MEYITKDGRSIEYRAVGRRYVDQILARHPVPSAPTYETRTVAGDVQVFTHDEKSARQTPGGELLWLQYLENKRIAVASRYTAASNFLLYSCVVQDAPPLDEWVVDLDAFDLTAPNPADKVAFKVFWIENELLPDPDDLAGLCAILYAMGGIIAEDKVQEFESFFRFTLARLALGGAASPAAGGSADSGA